MPVQAETHLKGLALSEGYAAARVCLFNEHRHRNLPVYNVKGAGIEREIDRVKQAVRIAEDRLNEIREQVEKRIGVAEAEIFVAHQMILKDKALHERIHALIEKEGINAESAVTRTLDEVEARLRDVDDEYIKERASDFGEIKRRLLDVLANLTPSLQCSATGGHCQKGKNRIVVAEELTPSLTVELDTDQVMGFVTERGGVNSHAAILARALGVPAVSGLAGIRQQILCGTEILVNGNTGEVVVWPTEETILAVRQVQPTPMRMPLPVDPVPGLKVMANISMASEIDDAILMKAEGVGLYRTEIEVIAAGRLLSEDELYERYAAVRRAVEGHAVIYRLYDLGSDKTLPTVTLPEEDNPSLGWRGARLLLGKTDLFRTQARALARVSQIGPVHVMYPMVIDLEQFLRLKKAFETATADIQRGEIHHGVMFEVPSACLQAGELLDHADFGSVGTNDLTQYLFAVDRGNEYVAYDYNPDRPVFWNLLQTMATAARARQKSLSVCGELAGDPRFVPQLKALGIDTISVSARRIPVVRAVAATEKGGKGTAGHAG